MSIALQMYSLHPWSMEDFYETLNKVSKFGFKEIELAGTFGKTPEELKAELDKLGLATVSAHVGYGVLIEQFDEQVACAKTLGCTRLVSPGVPVEDQTNPECWKKGAELLNELGKRLAKEGIRLGYQNHDHELRACGDTNGLEILISETNPEYVFFELETYWAELMGYSAVELIKKYPGRFEILHLKDMKEKASRDNTYLGNGVLDIPAIIKAGIEFGGTKLFVQKQENFDCDMAQSIENGLSYLKKLFEQ